MTGVQTCALPICFPVTIVTADFKLHVPCGHCDECLKKRQQQWFLRANHVMKRLKLRPEQCLFCTFSIKPEVYEQTKERPYLAIRRFMDRLRKHLVFVKKVPPVVIVTVRFAFRIFSL